MSRSTPPAFVSLEARIDLDGDAMTRETHSPSARLASVKLGATDVKLTLKPGA